MKADMTVTATSSNSISFASSSNDKYGGILKKSAGKILRKELSELVSYVYSVSPPFPFLHTVITIIRVLQIIGPSLNPGFSAFWETDPVSNKTLFIFTIFFYLIPPSAHKTASYPTMIVYIIITLIMILLLLICAKYYKKHADLPSFLPPLISFYFSSFGFILPPIAVEIMFSQFSMYFFDESANENVVRTIIILVISVVITVVYLYIFFTIALQVLTFQPMSLITVCTMPQNMIILSVIVINLFIGLSEFAKQTVTTVFCIISAIIYGASSLIVFYKGGLIKHMGSIIFLGSCFNGCVTCLIIAVFQILDMNATFIIIAIFIILEVLFVLLANFLLKKIVVKRLQILDHMVDDPEYFNHSVKSVNKFLNLVVTGFSELHPLCLNWSLLKMAIERWPKNGDIWFIYAKFCSIYPEETQTLAWIFRSIITNKVKGQAARTVKGQSLSIARQREANLSPDLKAKLNSATKHVTGAKHKLRNVWDMAIQGNTSDMEMATKRAIKAIKASNGTLMHIMNLFPNNRFVTRQYARFSKELLADYATCADMIEKSRLLQRNINVNKDQTHEYGITAFPMLPERLSQDKISVSPTTVNNEMTNSVLDLDETENESQEREESSVFLERIQKLRIPSTTGMAIISLLLYFVLFALPIIILLILVPAYIDSLTTPMEHMHSLSMVRTLMYQIIAFGLQSFFQKMDIFPQPTGTDPSYIPESFGSTYKTNEQLSFLCKEMTIRMQEMDTFRTYNKKNANMDKAKELVFQPTINYTYFSFTTPTFKTISLVSALSDIVSQQRELITDNNISETFVNTSAILNPSTSMTKIADNFNEALDLMIKYIADNDNDQEQMIEIIMIVYIIVSAGCFLAAAICGVRWIQSNKNETYRCLTSLPKNEVSQLAENLRILKKESESSTAGTHTNTESNKQEDNILKMFMTGGTNGATSHDSIYIATLILIIMVLHIVAIIILATTMKNISYDLRCNCPHLDYLQGMYANLVAATTCITSLIGFNWDITNISNVDKQNLLDRIDARLATTRDYYDLARYGGPTLDEPPFSAYQEFIDSTEEIFKCEDVLQLATDFKKASTCFTTDDLIVLTEGVYRSHVIPYQVDQDHYEYLPNLTEFRVIWDFLIFPIYDIFIYPMSESIIDTITKDLNAMHDEKMIYIIILIALGFVFEILFLCIIYSIDVHIRGVLKLLLHCQPKVIASTDKVMSVLDGNFKKNKGDNGTRSEKFYAKVVDDLPDAVIVCNHTQEFETANKSFARIFGEKLQKDLIGKPVTEFISSSTFSGNVGALLNVQPQKSVQENLSYLSPETSSMANLEVESTIINERLVFVFRDVTQTIRYNTLIKEEKQKSDKLLGSILPASLVPRVQAGEKNISFAVQSATIVFMDIVSFTPWCGSLPAEKVMSTLNLLFMKNDNLVAKYPTMTKIKCIGDCYMAAGGVFAEVNQPAVHAKEVVNFGLDALDAISELNKELNENLKIRVGINTGGPIVAGVLGIGKPTFEILGPAINMAQQMEHHGVPSQVHVSRSVYELIYGDTFEVKERGQIEVKNGKVVTYLVHRKK